MRLGEERHGEAFAKALADQLPSYMVDYAKGQGVSVVDFGGIVAPQKAIERLLIDKLDNKPKLNEAVAGAEYEIYHNVTLKRAEPVFDNGNPQAGFDYLITDDGKRLDFMYTMYGYPDKKIEMLNKFFAHNEREWQDKQQQIKDHLNKADIVPIDLRYLNVQNIIKLITFMVSLSDKQKKQIILIIGDTNG